RSLLAIERHAPVGNAPAAAGAKVTPSVVAPAASTVKGGAGVQVTPVVPAQREMPVTFSGAVPAFCTWAVSVFDVPAVTVAKSIEAGLSAMAGVVATPVPLRPKVMVGFAGSLLAMERHAPAGRAPAVVGANVTFT